MNQFFTNVKTMSSELINSEKSLSEVGSKLTKETSKDLEGLLNKKIKSKLEEIKITEIKELDNAFKLDTKAIQIYMRIVKDMNGTIAFVFPRETASELIKYLLEDEISKDNEFSNMELSALKETCNIFAGSFINNLAEILNNNPILSVPSLVFVTPKSLTSLILTGVDKKSQKAVFLKINIKIDKKPINFSIILLLDHEPLQALLKLKEN